MENFTEEISSLIQLPINNWVSITYMLLKDHLYIQTTHLDMIIF